MVTLLNRSTGSHTHRIIYVLNWKKWLASFTDPFVGLALTVWTACTKPSCSPFWTVNSSSIWDSLTLSYSISQKSPNFTARVVANNWAEGEETFKSSLGWPCSTLVDLSETLLVLTSPIWSLPCPASVLIRHPKPARHHKNPFPLSHPFVWTKHHKSSFLLDVVDKWNSVSEEIFPHCHNQLSKKLKALIFN